MKTKLYFSLSNSFLVLTILVSICLSSCGSTEVEKDQNKAKKVEQQAKMDSKSKPKPKQKPKPKLVQNKEVEGIKLIRKTFLNDKLSFLIPANFQTMPEDLIVKKYGADEGYRPNMVYSDPLGEVTIALQHTEEPMKNEDLDQYKEAFAIQFRQNPNVSLQRAEIVRINHRHDFIVYEFLSKTPEENIYNMMFVSNIDNRMAIGTFNAPQKDLVKWKPISFELLHSLEKASK